MDLTYISLVKKIFDVFIGVCLMTIVDWYSRQILSWRPWITLLFAGSG